MSIICFGQKSKNGWKTANLKCKVKTAGQVEYVPNEKNELIQQGQNFSANFNKQGNITEMITKSGNDQTKYVMEFDQNGFHIKTTAYDKDGKVTFHSEQKNDSQGNILMDKGFTDGDFEAFKTLFTYDKKGHLIEKKMYQFGNYANKSIFTNDKKGNALEEKNYDAQDALNHHIISKYDKKGNRIEAIAYDGKNNVIEHYTYKYDKFNNPIEEISFFEGASKSKKTFTYEYDKRKNWTKKYEFTDGKLTKVTEQTVHYF